MILGLLLFAGCAVVNCAAKSVNNDLEADINNVNSSIKSLSDSTQREVDRSVSLLEKRNSDMIAIKKTIKEDELNFFCGVFAKIKNFNLRETDLDYKKSFAMLTLQVESLAGSKVYKHNSDSLSGLEIAGELALTYLSPALSLGKNFAKFWKLSDSLDVAKANYEKAKIECEKAKQQCLVYKDAAKKCKEVSDVLVSLRHVFYMSITEMNEILKNNDYDYQVLSDSQKEVIMTSVNIASGINDIICTTVVNNDGTVNPDAVKVIRKAKKLNKANCN